MNTPTGGRKAYETRLERYGKDTMSQMGRAGGLVSRGGGFAKATPEQRRAWGAIGGAKSKRTKKLLEGE